MGIPTIEQTITPGADGNTNAQRTLSGPFQASQRSTDGTFLVGQGFVHSLTVSNDDAAKKTVSFYDDATGTTRPICTIVVPAGDTRTVTVNVAFYFALRAASASWTNVIASASYR